MRNKQVNHARNVWDRAVTLLPRAQQLWYKYAYMEEVLGNVTACRSVFERWMEWEPDPQAWHSYINFEYRYKVRDNIYKDEIDKFFFNEAELFFGSSQTTELDKR